MYKPNYLYITKDPDSKLECKCLIKGTIDGLRVIIDDNFVGWKTAEQYLIEHKWIPSGAGTWWYRKCDAEQLMSIHEAAKHAHDLMYAYITDLQGTLDMNSDKYETLWDLRDAIFGKDEEEA